MPQFSTLYRIARFGRVRMLSAVAIAGLAVVAGCNMDNTTGPPSSNQGLVQFINAAPRYPSVDLYVDSLGAVSAQAYASGQTISVNPLSTARKLAVRASGDTTTLAAGELQVASQQVYSVIVTQHTTGAGLLILPDTVSAPPANSIGLRVVNAAPSAGTVDVYITGADTTLRTPTTANVPFEGSSNYVYIPAGAGRVRVTAAGTKTVLLDVNASQLNPGQVRTVLMIDAASGGTPATWIGLPDIG